MIVAEPFLADIFGTREAPATALRYAVEAACIALVLAAAWLATRKPSAERSAKGEAPEKQQQQQDKTPHPERP